MHGKHTETHRKVLATIGALTATLAVGTFVLAARPTTAHGLELEPSAVDACGARSHSCAELTTCVGGTLPEGVGCLEMTVAEAREKGLVLE